MNYLLLLTFLTPILANQVSTDTDSSLASRSFGDGDTSSVDITAYSDSQCAHSSNIWKGKIYGQNQTWPSGFRSYKLSRALFDFEQLDFNTSEDSFKAGPQGLNGATVMDADKHPDFCHHFTKKSTASKDRTAGCHGVQPNAQCVNLWRAS